MSFYIKNSTNQQIASKSIILGIGICGLLLTAGCHDRQAQLGRVAPVVQVARIVGSDSAQDLVVSGQLDAATSVAVSFATLGSVERVLASEGQKVTKDQILAVLDEGQLRDQMAMAKAKADQAEDAWKRMEPMHRSGSLPEIKWVEVETGRDQARSSVSMARRNLDDALLKSPMTGIVSRRAIEPGERAQPGVSAFTVVDTRTMLATLSIPEKDISSIRPGMVARVEVDAVGQKLTGKVKEVGVAADPFTRTYKVKVEVANPGGALRVGMLARVRLAVPGRQGTPIAPVAALLVDERDSKYVWTLTDTVIHKRGVRIGALLQEGIAIDSGLAVGETVVVSGTPMLSEGMHVLVGK
ncbi:MAG: hypothetical protein RL173_676 [Fibrobacterota bacterium]